MARQILLSILLAFFSGAAFSAAPDLSTPEKTLAGYLESLSKGDKAGVFARYYGAKDFYVPRRMPIDKYTITKKIVYQQKEVDKWNLAGIKPTTNIGDVELQVDEIESRKSQMYTYIFRKFDNGWMIISHDAWGVD